MNVVSSNVINVPTNLYELINETYTEYASKNGNECYGNCLLNILKKYHLWPSMQIKKYKGTDNLVLLHNTYVRSDTSSYQALYEQCRSVVLDFSKSIGDNIVVTYSNSIPERIIINVLTLSSRFLTFSSNSFKFIVRSFLVDFLSVDPNLP